jgi:hypothetical protein
MEPKGKSQTKKKMEYNFDPFRVSISFSALKNEMGVLGLLLMAWGLYNLIFDRDQPIYNSDFRYRYLHPVL